MCFYIKSTKINNKKADRAPARARTGRTPHGACTGGRAGGIFVDLFDKKHTDFNKNTLIVSKNTLILIKNNKKHTKNIKKHTKKIF